MLKNPTFLDEEKNAPLLNMNLEDYLKKKSSYLLDEKAKRWRFLVLGEEKNDSENQPRTPIQILDTPRIIYLDAERTFVTDEHRKHLIRFLTRLFSTLKGDYAQALSYVSGFLLLILDEPSVMDIVVHICTDKKFLPGYYKEEAVAAATDAYVFQHLLQKFFPNVATHLTQQNLYPENYCQKWFGGLCIQILPFEALFPFFELFLEHGYRFLFQFGLSLVDCLKEELLKATDFAAIFELLRLDQRRVTISTSSAQPNDKTKRINPEYLVKHALDFDLTDVEFPKLREELFEKHLKERLNQAKQFFAESKKKSDEESDEESEEEGEDCELCHEMFPELLCKSCNLKICEKCHDQEKGDHKSSHKVVPYEPEEKGSDKEEDKSDIDKLTSDLKTKAKIKE